MDIRVIQSDGAPEPIGPYSQAVVAGGFVFCAGQIPLDPSTGSLVRGAAADQARRVLDNLEAVLRKAGSSLDNSVRLTIYLTSLDDFAAVNRVLQERLHEPYPARSTVQVAALPKGAAIEMDVIALAG